MRVFAFGGGVQSTAVLVLAAQGRLAYDACLFANVGDDSEHPATLRYVREVAMPFAAARGLTLHEIRRERPPDRPQTLYTDLLADRSGVRIPARQAGGAPGRRGCTGDWKIKVLARWMRAHGASVKSPATVGLGISLDEYHRARTDSGFAWQRLEYPLLDLGLRRSDCVALIGAAGLPVPPKSSCWFCPFKNRADWLRLRHDTPELFARAANLEAALSATYEALGRGPIYFHRSCRPLGVAVGEQYTLDDALDGCESGYCMT